jgi:hypothetical protein
MQELCEKMARENFGVEKISEKPLDRLPQMCDTTTADAYERKKRRYVICSFYAKPGGARLSTGSRAP